MAEKITPDLTLRQVALRYPGAMAVFTKYGLAGCGGPMGPEEPLDFFARAHNVDLDSLLAELNALADGHSPVPQEQSAPAGEFPWYKPFLVTSVLLAVLAGGGLGLGSLLARSFDFSLGVIWAPLLQVHGQVQIMGFAGLFIMGVSTQVLPRFSAKPLYRPNLALVSFVLVALGVGLRFLQPWATGPLSSRILVLSALAQFHGGMVFSWVAFKTLRRSEPYAKFLLVALFWLNIAGLYDLALLSYMADRGLSLAPWFYNQGRLHLYLWGFIVMFILGMTVRVIPGFMNLRAVNRRALGGAFWGLNLGLALHALFLTLRSYYSSRWLVAGLGGAAAVELGSLVAFVLALHLFQRRAGKPSQGKVDTRYEKYVRSAYGWLLAASSLAVAYIFYELASGNGVSSPFYSAAFHALTLGFIAAMIIGMASRIVPVFRGNRFYYPSLLLPIFLLLQAGVGLRVVGDMLSSTYGSLVSLSAVSGALSLGALGLFALAVIRTMTAPIKEEAVPEDKHITAKMVVAEVVEKYPQTLGVFLRYGFDQIANPAMRQTVGKTMTLEMASQIRGVDLEGFLADLNQAASGIPVPGAPQADGITADQIVGDILEKNPSLLEVFLRHGFHHLADEEVRQTLAKHVTVAMACRVHGIPLEALLKDLNAQLTRR